MRSIKIKIKNSIENIDTNDKTVYNLEGTKQKNIIKFFDNEYNNTVIIEKDNINILRNNNEVEYELIFKNNQPTETKYLLKEYNMYLNIIIITKSIEITEKEIIVKYTQKIQEENTEYIYTLNWEVKDE